MKKVISLILALVLCFAFSAPAFATYDDVAPGAWYAEEVNFCLDKGILTAAFGTTGSLNPNQNITRAEFVSMLFSMDTVAKYDGIRNVANATGYAGEKPESAQHHLSLISAEMIKKVADSKFTDVDFNAYYGPAVIWAAENGYVNSTSETTFSPDDTITREQMMTMLYRYQYTEGLDFMYRTEGADGVDNFAFGFYFDTYGEEVVVDTGVLNNYIDGSTVSAFAKDGIQSGYITGVSATEVAPAGTASRAQVATIFARMYDNVVFAATRTMYLHHLELRGPFLGITGK